MTEENNWFNRQSLNHPVLVCFFLLIIALIFRIIDIFILRLDDRLGEIILSKSLGFILIIIFLYLAGKSLAYIGLNRQKAGKAFFIGGIGMLLIFIVACGIQLAYLNLAGVKATLALTAADLYSGTTGSSVFFILLLLVGNVINSFMEEGLFRGLMIRHFLSSSRNTARTWSLLSMPLLRSLIIDLILYLSIPLRLEDSWSGPPPTLTVRFCSIRWTGYRQLILSQRS